MYSSLNTLFVYGTLKRGEINHGLLAPHARSIESGTIRGLLYDTGDFPALAEGDGSVHGELVQLDAESADAAIAVIDRLENCIPGRDELSLYHRRVVTATTADSATREAYAYFYNAAHPALLPLASLVPVESGIWTAPPIRAHPSGLASFEEYRAWVREFVGREQ